MTWQAHVLSLFPDMFPGPLACSLAGTARKTGAWSLHLTNPRDFASDKHHSVDDTPSGGGAGMVMKVDVLATTLDSVRKSAPAGTPTYCLSARGKPLDQALVRELSQGPGAILICGRFEGIDERLFSAREVEEVCIGDYVLSGGEPAAIVLLDAVIRLLPGVVGREQSLDDESFETGLLEYPQYTRPQEFEGLSIPEVLTTGHHRNIAAWRRTMAEMITRERRPDLWKKHQAGQDQKRVKR